MTIEEAIERYTSNAEYERTHENLQGCLEFRQLAEWLTELRQLREQTRWIPVSERLPEKQGCYLVTTKWKGSYSGDVYIETNMAVYREKPKEWDCANVIAWMPWMPLPEQYKAESEG